MLKILLVYDDFQELTSVELMLKKIGFDVVGITSEFSLAEQLLSFNPQIVIAQGRTAKVSTANVGRRLRESLRWDGRSILIFYPNAKPQPTELLKIRMDVGLEYPVEPTKMVQVLAQLGSLDANQLLDKLIKNMAQETAASQANSAANLAAKSERESVYVSGGQTANDQQSRGIGGAAGTQQDSSVSIPESLQTKSTSQNGLGSSESEPEFKQDISGSLEPLNGKDEITGLQESSNSEKKPIFPLAPEDVSLKTNVTGSGPKSETDPTGLTGTFGINPFSLDNLTQDPLMQELENLLQKKQELSLVPPTMQDPARHKKYEEYMKTIPVQELASIKRRDAKSRLRDLIKDIDMAELGDQDVLRREYVKALFKKEE